MPEIHEGVVEDRQAQNVTSILHEKRGGYAHNTKALYRLPEGPRPRASESSPAPL